MPIYLRHRQECGKLEPLGAEILAAAGLSVNQAEDGIDLGAALAQFVCGFNNLTTRCDDILDENKLFPRNLSALGELAGAVFFGFFSNK